MKFALLVLILIAFVKPSYALFTFGSYSNEASKYQINDQGETQNFSHNLYLGLSAKRNFTGPHFFMPALGYVKHSVESEDEYSKSAYILTYAMGYQINNVLMVRYGLANIITKISGDGQTKEQNNGTSTDIYFKPGAGYSSYNTSLVLGLESSVFNENFSFVFDTHILNMWESDSRTISFLMGVNYYL